MARNPYHWTAIALMTAVAAMAEDVRPVDESAKLKAALSRSQEHVEVSQLPDGTTKIDLNGGFQHASMIRINKDGQIETYCSEHVHLAERFLRGETMSPVTAAGEMRR